MDGKQFDALTRSFGKGLTRRQFATAVGSALIGALGASGRAAAAKCRKADSVCRKGSDCCSGLCGDKDEHGRRRCACPAGTQVCKGDCVDPAAGFASDPKNCGACGNACKRTRCGLAVCNGGICGVVADANMVGRSCDDGNLCTEGDVCQADGSCAGTQVTCAVTEPRCQSATCNPATGKCETTNFDAGTSCANDTRCDGDEACNGNGVCEPGVPVQCVQPSNPCQVATCDAASGTCVTSNAADSTSCSEFGVPDGVCCGGICSQCCGDASVCANLFEETENVVFSCQDPDQVGSLNCLSECDSSIISQANPICTNPAVLAGVNQQCVVGGQPVTCLNCRLPVGSTCGADTECCGFCVDGTCEAGATGSPCVDGSDCDASLYCDSQGTCAQPLLIGAACVPATDVCVAGTSCGNIIGSNVDTFCCLPIDAACTVDDDCCQDGGVQERCVLGICKTRGQSGAACGKDFDCAGTLTCIGGTCGPRPPLGGTCDTDGDCVFDTTSNTQPVCSSGICRLPNGATTTDNTLCATGAAVQCDYGTICGECCATDVTGFDPVFCGDLQSEKICCNHTCRYRNDDAHCGMCNVDCTCGGADPYRYCTTQYDSQTPSWDWRAVCKGTYSASSGHCAQVTSIGSTGTTYDYCSTTCPAPEVCDCTQPLTSLFCYAACIGANPNSSLATCSQVDEYCLNGNDDTCCGDATCESQPNCSPGVTFCLSDDYVCVAA